MSRSDSASPIFLAASSACALVPDAATVQSWYMNLKRDILAKKGLDYRTDPKRIFNLGAADGRAYRPGEKP